MKKSCFIHGGLKSEKNETNVVLINQVECSINGSNPCEVHCQVPNRPNTCQSSTKLNSFFPQPIHRAPGALCDMPMQVNCAKHRGRKVEK